MMHRIQMELQTTSLAHPIERKGMTIELNEGEEVRDLVIEIDGVRILQISGHIIQELIDNA